MTIPPIGRPVLLAAFVLAVSGLVVATGASPALADSKGSRGPGDAKEVQHQQARAGSAEDQSGADNKKHKKHQAASQGPVRQSSANGAQEQGGSKPSSDPKPDRTRDEKKQNVGEKNGHAHGGRGGPPPTAEPPRDRPIDQKRPEAQPDPPLAPPASGPVGVRGLSDTSGVAALLRLDVVAQPGSAGPDAPPLGPAPLEIAAEPSPAIRPVLGAAPSPPPRSRFVPSLDDPAFPALLLAALALFLAVFGRGDRRDPKLVEAVVDDRTQDVDFS